MSIDFEISSKNHQLKNRFFLFKKSKKLEALFELQSIFRKNFLLAEGLLGSDPGNSSPAITRKISLHFLDKKIRKC